MTKEKQEQGKARQESLYARLIRGAQNLTRRVADNRRTENFDDFVEEHNRLVGMYVTGFDKLSTVQSTRASQILGHTRNYIHGSLDVNRIGEMREVMIQGAKNYQKHGK